MPRCDCGTCRARRVWGVRDTLAAVPPWGHEVLVRLALLEGDVVDFSGLEQAIADQKTVDDQILAKLDELTAAAATANSQGDQAAVSSAVVAIQQHVADVRAALAASDQPAAPAADGAAPAGDAAQAPVPADPAPADPAPADPAQAPSAPASGGDAVVAQPGT